MVDKAYEAARNKLIPEAEAIANKRVAERTSLFGDAPVYVEGKKDPVTGKTDKFKWSFFSQFFHEEMNRLAMSTGLVRG